MEGTTVLSSTTVIGLSVGRDLIVHNGDVTSVIVNRAPEPPPIVTQFQQFEFPTPNFTGRESILNELHFLMRQCQTKGEYIEKIVVLYGCGGIGKSELARAFAKSCTSTPGILNVACINADSLAALTLSFTRLARKLQINTDYKRIEDLVQEVYEHFSENIQKGLLIFDNARQMNDDEFPLINYMPAYLDTYPLFLITTRHNTWDEISSENKIHVHELSKDEAVKFLTKRFQLSDEQQNSPEITNALNDLAEALQGYPLALALAGSNIPNPKVGWMELTENIRKYIEGMNVPEGGWANHKQTGAPTKYKLIMDNVWDLTLEQIKTLEDGDDAFKLLNLLAYALPDDITIKKIGKIYKRTYDTPHSEMGLHLLEQYSLISIYDEYYAEDFSIIHPKKSSTFYIRIHRLIQRCTSDRLDRMQDDSYLLGHCKYLLRPGYDGNTILSANEDKIHIHRHLKKRRWRGGFIAYSVFFMNHVMSQITPEIVKDLFDFLKEIDNDSDVVCQEAIKLLFLYMFAFKYKYFTNKVELSLFSIDVLEKCDIVFEEYVYFCTQQLLSSESNIMVLMESFKETNVANIARKRSFDLCQSILFPANPDIWNFKHMISRVVDIVRETVASTNGGCRLDYIPPLYRLLWECNWNVFDENPAVAFDCVRLVFAKHVQLWPSLVTVNDQHIYWLNWEKHGVLPVYYILKQMKKNAHWRKLFLELYAHNGDVPKIFVHALENMNLVGFSAMTYQFFELLVRLGGDWGFAEKLVQSAGFMNALLGHTQQALEADNNIFYQHQLWVLVSWFGIFSHNETFRDTNGQSWSILSVAVELEIFLNLMESNEVCNLVRETKLMHSFLDATSSLTGTAESMAIPTKFAQAYLRGFCKPKINRSIVRCRPALQNK